MRDLLGWSHRRHDVGVQREAELLEILGIKGIGDGDLQTLLDVYGHHHPDHMQDAVQKMARPMRRAV